MNKTVRFGLFFFGILLVLYIVNSLLTGFKQDDIGSYLMNMGYTQDSEDNTRLFKMIDSNTINYFSTAEYTLTQNTNDKNNSFQYSLTMRYDYKNHELSYNYRTTYSNNINVIFKGTYNGNDYICDKEFSTATLSRGEIDSTCSLIELKVNRFYKEAEVLFLNHHFVEYMEKVKLD